MSALKLDSNISTKGITRLKAECFSLNGHEKGSPERVLRKATQKGY